LEEATGTGFLVPIDVLVGVAFWAPSIGFLAGALVEPTAGVFFTGVGPLLAVVVFCAPVTPGTGFLVPIGVLAGFEAPGVPEEVETGVFLTGVPVGFFAGVSVCRDPGFFTVLVALAGVLLAPSAALDMFDTPAGRLKH
jgi:hypothetical protein